MELATEGKNLTADCALNKTTTKNCWKILDREINFDRGQYETSCRTLTIDFKNLHKRYDTKKL